MATIIYPCADRLAEHGPEYSVLSDIPIVVNSYGSLIQAATDYIRDRGLFIWRAGAKKRPSAGSLRTYAYALTNFLDWCEDHKLDWRVLERGDDLTLASVVGYARMMALGRWSQSGGPIERGILEQRAATAQDFLCFAADRKMRGPYHSIPIKGYGRPGNSRDSFDIPDKFAVKDWLRRLRADTVPSKWLMAQLIFESGMRRAEVVMLAREDLPESKDLKAGEFQHFWIHRGTKGGRARIIRVRTTFLKRLLLHADDEKERPAALKVFESDNPGADAPIELFLNPATGSRWSLSQPNKLFKLGLPAPSDQWSPHVGRHFYACWTLLEFLEEEGTLAGLRPRELIPSTLEAFGKPSLLRLQKYLGHASVDTTELYLAWVSEHLRVNRLSEGA